MARNTNLIIGRHKLFSRIRTSSMYCTWEKIYLQISVHQKLASNKTYATATSPSCDKETCIWQFWLGFCFGKYLSCGLFVGICVQKGRADNCKFTAETPALARKCLAAPSMTRRGRRPDMPATVLFAGLLENQRYTDKPTSALVWWADMSVRTNKVLSHFVTIKKNISVVTFSRLRAEHLATKMKQLNKPTLVSTGTLLLSSILSFAAALSSQLSARRTHGVKCFQLL